jgi:hypothetical protein
LDVDLLPDRPELVVEAEGEGETAGGEMGGIRCGGAFELQKSYFKEAGLRSGEGRERRG